MALLAIYSNVQKARRDQIETVTITPAPPPRLAERLAVPERQLRPVRNSGGLLRISMRVPRPRPAAEAVSRCSPLRVSFE